MSYEKAEAKENGGSVYDITNEWVASIEPQDNNIIFLPFINFFGLAIDHSSQKTIARAF